MFDNWQLHHLPGLPLGFENSSKVKDWRKKKIFFKICCLVGLPKARHRRAARPQGCATVGGVGVSPPENFWFLSAIWCILSAFDHFFSVFLNEENGVFLMKRFSFFGIWNKRLRVWITNTLAKHASLNKKYAVHFGVYSSRWVQGCHVMTPLGLFILETMN